jgi:thiol-disulfide isomerase/thioredoxin
MSTEPAPAAGLPRSTFITWLGLLVLGAGFLAFLTSSSNRRHERIGKEHPGVGRRLVRLDLYPLLNGGEPLTLSSLEGRVALINLWGTWCGPCRREFPQLQKLEQQFSGEPDFKFVSVSCGQESPEDLDDLRRQTEAYVREMGATFPIYADPEAASRKSVFNASFSTAMPTTIVLDRTGKVRGVWTGYASGDERVMESLIRELLAEPTGGAKPEAEASASAAKAA